jgi:hypothetical protein
MARGKKLQSVQIAGDTFEIGDTVSLRPPDNESAPFVAK